MKLLILVVSLAFPTLQEEIKITDSDFCKVCNCSSDTKSVHCEGNSVPLDIFNETFWLKDNNANKSYPFEKITLHKTLLTRIQHIPRSPVKTLDFSDNLIQQIDKYSFKELTNLTELILFDNGLISSQMVAEIFEGHHIPGSYLPLPNLRVLRLGANKLHTLASNLFEHVDKIQILDLHANPFKVLDHNTIIAITNLVYLEELDLSETEIRELSPHFLHTPKYLKKLNLARNRLEALPTSLEYAHALEWLNLDGNPIKMISSNDVFPPMPHLKILHMCYMPELERIDDFGLSGLIALKQLHVSNNYQLISLSANAMSRVENGSESETWPNLEQIILRNNKLTHLERHFFGNLETIEEIDISGNPWTCECENQWLVDTLMHHLAMTHRDNDTKWQDTKCAAPVEMEGQSLFHLYVHNASLRCLDLYGNQPEKDGSLLIGMLLGLLISIPVVLGAIFCYKKNFFSLFDGGPASFSRQFYKRASPGEEDF